MFRIGSVEVSVEGKHSVETCTFITLIVDLLPTTKFQSALSQGGALRPQLSPLRHVPSNRVNIQLIMCIYK